jgi:hypothetical protein
MTILIDELVPPEYDDTNWETCPLCGDDGKAGDMRSKLAEWFAAERRATVERIRERLFAYYKASDSGAAQHPGIFTILDEEAAR